MKKMIALMALIALCFSMTACGKEKHDTENKAETVPSIVKPDKVEKPPKPDSDTEKSDNPSKVENDTEKDTVSSTVLETVTVKEYTIAYVGAEKMKNDGEDTLCVFYEFTNNSDESISASYAIKFDAVQNNAVLDKSFASGNADELYYDILKVRPGCTIRCAEEVILENDSDDVYWTVFDWGSEEQTTVFALDDLPGVPAEEYVLETIDDPTWIEDWSDEGDIDNAHVFIDAPQTTENYAGEELIRVVVEFTNNSSEDLNPLFEMPISAYQDGVALETGFAKVSSDSDNAYYDDVAPGKTVTVSQCFVVRTRSPIEVELGYDDEIGTMFRYTGE